MASLVEFDRPRRSHGDKSMSRPRAKGPRSLIRTVTHPSWQTLTSVPKEASGAPLSLRNSRSAHRSQ